MSQKNTDSHLKWCQSIKVIITYLIPLMYPFHSSICLQAPTLVQMQKCSPKLQLLILDDIE